MREFALVAAQRHAMAAILTASRHDTDSAETDAHADIMTALALTAIDVQEVTDSLPTSIGALLTAMDRRMGQGQ